MITIPVKYHLKFQLSEQDPQIDRAESEYVPHESMESVDQIKREEAELLTIAMHLSQAVVRVGNAPINYDSYRQRNDALDYAQKCRQDLQVWMGRYLGKA